MSWLAEAFDYLREKFAPVTIDVGDKKFSNKKFTEIEPDPDPLSGQFDVTTLTALRDLINCNAEKINDKGGNVPIIHIVNHTDVRLELGVSDEHGRRLVFAKASPVQYDGFKFNQYYSIDGFIIGVQAHFAPTPDRDYLLATSARITDEAVRTSEDDGISQQVTVSASLALKATETLKSRVSLRPFRIFPEVEQPQSEFVFRARKGQNGIELALFEADGGKWKLAAIENIAYRLRELDIKLPIIA